MPLTRFVHFAPGLPAIDCNTMQLTVLPASTETFELQLVGLPPNDPIIPDWRDRPDSTASDVNLITHRSFLEAADGRTQYGVHFVSCKDVPAHTDCVTDWEPLSSSSSNSSELDRLLIAFRAIKEGFTAFEAVYPRASQPDTKFLSNLAMLTTDVCQLLVQLKETPELLKHFMDPHVGMLPVIQSVLIRALDTLRRVDATTGGSSLPQLGHCTASFAVARVDILLLATKLPGARLEKMTRELKSSWQAIRVVAHVLLRKGHLMAHVPPTFVRACVSKAKVSSPAASELDSALKMDIVTALLDAFIADGESSIVLEPSRLTGLDYAVRAAVSLVRKDKAARDSVQSKLDGCCKVLCKHAGMSTFEQFEVLRTFSKLPATMLGGVGPDGVGVLCGVASQLMMLSESLKPEVPNDVARGFSQLVAAAVHANTGRLLWELAYMADSTTVSSDFWSSCMGLVSKVQHLSHLWDDASPSSSSSRRYSLSDAELLLDHEAAATILDDIGDVLYNHGCDSFNRHSAMLFDHQYCCMFGACGQVFLRAKSDVMGVCNRCGRVRYCCSAAKGHRSECQELHWAAAHKRVCRKEGLSQPG